jgi:hypothetical protein
MAMNGGQASHVGRGDRGVRAVAAALGVCVGVSGLDHGFFEILQGDTPTPGLVVQAIGPAQRMWVYGTEEAFTLVPDFLLSGILAMLVGLATILWSVAFLDGPGGSRVLLLLGLLLLLVGGGIGMLVFLLAGWLVARRYGRPLAWVPSVVPGRLGAVLSKGWPAFVAVGLGLYAFALEVAIVGIVPGVSDPDMALAVCWAALSGVLVAFGLALVGSSAARPLIPRSAPGAATAARATVPSR